MNVLVINAGSSSLKFQLLDVDTREVYAKGNCERIGIDGAFVGYESIAVEGKQKIEAPLPDHKTAMQYVIDIINATGKDFIGIGHRVVQGGWYFPESKVVTDESLGWVREVAPLAPLHNYAEADAIEVCRELFPDKGNVVVADTSFHCRATSSTSCTSASMAPTAPRTASSGVPPRSSWAMTSTSS